MFTSSARRRRVASRAAASKQRAAVAVAVLLLVVASASAAQFGRGRGGRRGFATAAAFATFADFDGGFQFCRIVFRTDRNGDGNGWDVDWPRADENLSIRLSELTRIPVSMDEEKQPKHLLRTLPREKREDPIDIGPQG
jgi:hypothetical protein